MLLNCIANQLFEAKDELGQHKQSTPKFLSDDGQCTAAYIWIVGCEFASIIIRGLELTFAGISISSGEDIGASWPFSELTAGSEGGDAMGVWGEGTLLQFGTMKERSPRHHRLQRFVLE